jgi:hypothetical protein
MDKSIELISQMSDELTILRTIVHARSSSSGQHQASVKSCRHNECVTAADLVVRAREIIMEGIHNG